PEHDLLAGALDQEEPDPVWVVRRGEQRDVAEPTLERLWIAHARPDIDDPGQARLVEPLSGRRQLCDAGDSPAPGRCRRGEEADVVDDGRRGVDVRPQLSAGTERVDQQALAVAGEEELGQVNVPG